MKKGFQCEFCSEFSENSEAIQEHEKVCSYKPASQICKTCQHGEYYMQSGKTDCKIGLDTLEDGIACKKWLKITS
ncbi:hypothetical protein KKA14_20680 [bacterium]|nr:hypothetical protein [bacterium]